jgi:regulator of protease activity HflC (stomatin/prohibitin superfamily)
MASPADRPATSLNGFLMLPVWLATIALAIWIFATKAQLTEQGIGSPAFFGLGLLVVLAWVIMLTGFVLVQPNQARVLVFFGRYNGTLRDNGFHWVNPLTNKKLVSLRAQNFQSERLKVNDARGIPIEIAAVVVWRVRDPSRAIFEVESYGAFVSIQSETAVRTLASHFPYDAHGPDGEVASLRGSPDAVCSKLRDEVQGRLDLAGLEVMEARLSHLAYAPEIAQSMLRRQQADAVIAARTKLVDGAVGMVELALRRLAEGKIVALDEERKAAMVNNLMVALVSEEATQPVINAGTMYS